MQTLRLTILFLLVGNALAAESPDLAIYADANPHREQDQPRNIVVNGKMVGVGREGFAAAVKLVAAAPAGASIVWGPNWRRCGSCAGGEENTHPDRLYPELWRELERLVKDRKLTLSSSYPGPSVFSVDERPKKVAGEVRVGWSHYHGPQTPRAETLFLLDDEVLGPGEQGVQRLQAKLAALDRGTRVSFPRYSLAGRWATEGLTSEEVRARNRKLATDSPLRRDEIEAVLAKRGLKSVSRDVYLSQDPPRTALDYVDDPNLDFLRVGRVIRHDEDRPSSVVHIGWTDYAAAQRRDGRDIETKANYTLNGEEQGRGVAGFTKIIDKLKSLPEKSTVQVQVCLRTRGPFTCPLVYEGQRHFERTGFEPYLSLLPWLIQVAEERKLDIAWIPDERNSCQDCELNK